LELNDELTWFLVSCCGVCGTDGHIHEGEFIAKFPLIPGHEAIGKVVEMGKNVKGFEIGDRCVADVGISVRRLASRCITWITSHDFNSAVLVSIVVVAMSFSVRTLVLRVSPWMAVLRNTSNSKSFILCCAATILTITSSQPAKESLQDPQPLGRRLNSPRACCVCYSWPRQAQPASRHRSAPSGRRSHRPHPCPTTQIERRVQSSHCR
jgi:hypothetical protein